MLAAFVVFSVLFKASRAPRAGADGKTHPLLRMRNLCLKLVIFMLFLIYPSVSNTILKMFSCRTLGNGKSYLTADYSIECGGAKVHTHAFSGKYSFDAYRAWAGAAVLVYPIGVPIFFFIVLWLQRGALFVAGTDEPAAEAKETLGFLYAGYRPKYWWWECVELFRKLALTGIIAFFKPGTSEQLFLGIVLAVAFIVGYAREKPYLKLHDSDLQLACQLQVFFVSLSAFAMLTMAQRDRSANPFVSSAFEGVLLLVGTGPIILVAMQMACAGAADGGDEDSEVQSIIHNEDEKKKRIGAKVVV